MNNNILLLTDSYKYSHYLQYPEGTKTVYSYFESRIGAKFPETMFFGLNYFIKRYLSNQVTMNDVNEARDLVKEHIGDGVFNYDGWKYIVQKHNGFLPVDIWAVKEGRLIPTDCPLMVIYNTDPNVPWLTNFLETILCNIWYPCTVATQSYNMKKIIKSYMEDTCDNLDGLLFKLHDFGCRGVTCPEQAALGGAAHLINFRGTDTVPAIKLIKDYYNFSGMPGFSIPASEHSTITSWGRNNEVDAMRNMLEKYPTGLVACVSDSYDIFNACEKYWGEDLRDKVLARDGTLVIRPDSGNPHKVIPTILKILGDKFGYTVNTKGYKVLNPKVRVIQGDGIDINSLDTILFSLRDCGWSADNIAFGSGGGLLQKIDRDTQKFAFKCSAINVNNEWRDVYKEPITDSKKKSKSGVLCLKRLFGAHGSSYYTETKNPVNIREFLSDSEFVNYPLHGDGVNFTDVRYQADV